MHYFDRVRGLFRICFPYDEKPKRNWNDFLQVSLKWNEYCCYFYWIAMKKPNEIETNFLQVSLKWSKCCCYLLSDDEKPKRNWNGLLQINLKQKSCVGPIFEVRSILKERQMKEKLK